MDLFFQRHLAFFAKFMHQQGEETGTFTYHASEVKLKEENDKQKTKQKNYVETNLPEHLGFLPSLVTHRLQALHNVSKF